MNAPIAKKLHDIVLHSHNQGRHDTQSKNRLRHVKQKSKFIASECNDSDGSESEFEHEPVKTNKKYMLEDSDDDSVQAINARKNKANQAKRLGNRKRQIEEIEEDEIKQSENFLSQQDNFHGSDLQSLVAKKSQPPSSPSLEQSLTQNSNLLQDRRNQIKKQKTIKSLMKINQHKSLIQNGKSIIGSGNNLHSHDKNVKISANRIQGSNLDNRIITQDSHNTINNYNSQKYNIHYHNNFYMMPTNQQMMMSQMPSVGMNHQDREICMIESITGTEELMLHGQKMSNEFKQQEDGSQNQNWIKKFDLAIKHVYDGQDMKRMTSSNVVVSDWIANQRSSRVTLVGRKKYLMYLLNKLSDSVKMDKIAGR